MKEKLAKYAAALAVALVAVGVCHAGILNEDIFTRRMPVKFTGYTGTSALTNFPVLVRLSTDIPDFDYEEFYAGGTDLRFADQDGLELDHEVDTWDTDGTSLVWVRIPELTDETEIYAYWGSGVSEYGPSQSDGSVWNSGDYFGVWHLNESAAALDSSGNALHGTLHNTSPVAAGRLGAARQISDGAAKLADGSGIEIPNYNSLGVGSTFTVSTWLKYKTGQTPGYDVSSAANPFTVKLPGGRSHSVTPAQRSLITVVQAVRRNNRRSSAMLRTASGSS